MIDQFKDAVYAKNYRILEGIVSSQLNVYANKAAFDAKTSLEEDEEIGNYGGSKKDALLVVAPDQIAPASAPSYALQAISSVDSIRYHNCKALIFIYGK